jgi:hypothetical protein
MHGSHRECFRGVREQPTCGRCGSALSWFFASDTPGNPETRGQAACFKRQDEVSGFDEQLGRMFQVMDLLAPIGVPLSLL